LFVNSKVIYSVYHDDFKKSLDVNFRNKLRLNKISDEDTELVDDPSYLNISKMAIQYSDAIIQGSPKINPELSEYIQSSGKLVLEYQPEHTYIDAYNDLYDKML